MKNIIWQGTSDDSRYAELAPGVVVNIFKHGNKYHWKIRKESSIVGEGNSTSMKVAINCITKKVANGLL